ncbi:MAG: HRDC domain-containing protein [Spirochaetota bacterium]
MNSEYIVFNISLEEPVPDLGELNLFIRKNRIVQVDKRLTRIARGSAWTFMIEYIPRGKAGLPEAGQKPGIDYRDVLSEPDFALFLKMKEVRTTLAEAAGLPVYAVFTNEQLSRIAQGKPGSLAALREIKGIGEAKAASYGQQILACLSVQAF